MPARLGRYAVRRRIGSGGFATVWLAYDEQLDSPVAIKVLAENWTEDGHVRQRFLEEGRFLRKVESPHVVTVYDAGQLEDDRPYLVMTYADQGTLADRLELDGLTAGQVSEVIGQVGDGLHALHQRGVLHRDVKPANVLFRTVDVNGGATVRAMVGDLGLGKALDMSSRLTMIAGTPTFVAPEQAQGEHLDARADQYSLAALTYLLLSGRPPYTHGSLAAAASPGPPPALSTPEREFPAAVDDVVRRGLAIDRDDRWPDVPSFVAALREALGEQPGASLPERWLPVDPQLTLPGNRPSITTAAPGPWGEPSDVSAPHGWRRWATRRRALVAGLGLVLFVAGGLGGWLGWRAVDRDVTLTDAQDSLSVTVPEAWAGHASVDPWRPPPAGGRMASLSAGSVRGWSSTTGGQGVFLGLLASNKLPRQVPQHPGCGHADPAVTTSGTDPSRTVYFTGCPGVLVERVVQVAGNRILWVQVRADDRRVANDVLDSVSTHGL